MSTDEHKTEPIVITLGGVEYVASLPDYETRFELAVAWSENKTRGSAAIFGACLPGLMPPGQTYEAHNCNAMRYGKAVWGVLRKAGVDVAEMVEASMPLVLALNDAIMPEVAERAVFTSATGEGGTS